MRRSPGLLLLGGTWFDAAHARAASSDAVRGPRGRVPSSTPQSVRTEAARTVVVP